MPRSDWEGLLPTFAVKRICAIDAIDEVLVPTACGWGWAEGESVQKSCLPLSQRLLLLLLVLVLALRLSCPKGTSASCQPSLWTLLETESHNVTHW